MAGMRGVMAFLAALAAAAPVAGCSQSGSGQASASVTVPFNPPLGQPLYYRFRESAQGPDGDRTSQSLFVLTFSRAPEGLVMAVSSLRPNGARVSEAGLPAALADRRFRVGPRGELLGMENESAYWAALEPLLAEHGPTEAAAREAQAMIQSARDSRALPLEERMNHLARNAWPITFYAGDTFTREPREARASKRSIVGEIEGTRRTFIRENSRDRIVIVESFVTSPERMQAAMDNLNARFGRRPAGVGARHISNISEITTVLDPRTGLVRRRQERQEMVSEDAGRTLRRGVTSSLEQVDAPGPASARPERPVQKAEPARER